MIKTEHTPTTHDANSYTIVGGSIDELIDNCVNRIRPQSKDYYRKVIKDELEKSGKSSIDRHAGMGIYYTIKLK